MIAICVALATANLFVLASGQDWKSPCPNLFAYDPAGVQGDMWNGDITVKTDTELAGIWMRIVLDRPPLEVATDFGEVVQRESAEYLIRKPSNKLAVGEVQKIRLTVRFNTMEPAPQLVGFRLNARAICPETEVIEKVTAAPLPAFPAVSPCPDLFQYEPLNETDKWFGVVQIKSDTELGGVWLKIILDIPSVQLGVSDKNWFGEVTTSDNKEYLIKKPGYKVLPGVVTPVRFFIKFPPGGPIPKIAEIRLNTKPICQAGGIIMPITPAAGLQTSGAITPPVTQPTFVIGGGQFPRPGGGSNGDDDDFYTADFRPGRKPISGGKGPDIQSIDLPEDQDPEYISEDKILVFPKFYYVIQKFPDFTLIHIKRRNKGSAIGLGNFRLPFII